MRAGCTLDEVRGLARGHDRQGGAHLRPGRRTYRSAARRAASTATRTTRAPWACCAATSSPSPATSSGSGRPGRTSACGRARSTRSFAEAGLASSIQAVLPAARRRAAGAASGSRDGVRRRRRRGRRSTSSSAATAWPRRRWPRCERLGLLQCDRARVQGFGSMGGATARSSRAPASAWSESPTCTASWPTRPGSTWSGCCSPATRTARIDRAAAATRETCTWTARSGSTSTPTCSFPPRSRT